MECPFCHSIKLSVIDSRTDINAIRRRRECQSCSERFTTFERIEQFLPAVIKKDGNREPFDCNKIRTGILRACAKRPVSSDAVDTAVEKIFRQFIETHRKEVTSEEVGEGILQELKCLDQIAFVRFASVYREFSDVQQFIELLKTKTVSK
jgi:transcriptional repressor NrdR